MQSKKTAHPLNMKLEKVLTKCNREEGLDDDDQPVYIDWELETILCRWCSSFKGSIEARVMNQHTRSSKMHLLERQRYLHPDQLSNPLEGVKDIRTYFQS